jgi:hypothetical protein
VVRSIDVKIEDKDGKVLEGDEISELDAKRLFEYYPVLGQKFNDSLLVQTKIAPKESLDRMIAARFEVPEAQIQSRKKITLRIEDVDGAVSEISQ